MRADLIASAMAGSIYFERLQVFVGLVNDLSCMQICNVGEVQFTRGTSAFTVALSKL